MSKSTPALSAPVVLEFCALCDRAHLLWLNHLELFDKNPRSADITNSTAKDEWILLSEITQEHSLLQIIKLHDKAALNGNITLGIEYVLIYGGWSDHVRPRLKALEKELKGFAGQLRDLRNKILSHNDLASIVTGAPLGRFSDGDDERYFKALQEFVNIVHEQVIGGPYPFSYTVRNNVAYFLRSLKPIPLKKGSSRRSTSPMPDA